MPHRHRIPTRSFRHDPAPARFRRDRPDGPSNRSRGAYLGQVSPPRRAIRDPPRTRCPVPRPPLMISQCLKPTVGEKPRPLAGRPNASVARREGNSFPVENPPMGPDMIAWADRLTDCFYWTNRRQTRRKPISRCSTMWAGASRRSAEALALVRGMPEEHPGNPKGLERSLPLVAKRSRRFGRLSSVSVPAPTPISWRSSSG